MTLLNDRAVWVKEMQSDVNEHVLTHPSHPELTTGVIHRKKSQLIGDHMNKKSGLVMLYYTLALVGLLATWYYNGQYFLSGGGLGPNEFFGAAFANFLTTAITVDVYLSALVFSVWVISDSKRISIKWPWLYIAMCFFIGLAVAFPLYLAQRESAFKETAVSA